MRINGRCKWRFPKKMVLKEFRRKQEGFVAFHSSDFRNGDLKECCRRVKERGMLQGVSKAGGSRAQLPPPGGGGGEEPAAFEARGERVQGWGEEMAGFLGLWQGCEAAEAESWGGEGRRGAAGLEIIPSEQISSPVPWFPPAEPGSFQHDIRDSFSCHTFSTKHSFTSTRTLCVITDQL